MAKKDKTFKILVVLMIITGVLVSVLMTPTKEDSLNSASKTPPYSYIIAGEEVAANMLVLKGEDDELFYEIIERNNTRVTAMYEGLSKVFKFDLSSKDELETLKKDLEKNGYDVNYNGIDRAS